jgi:hypothetical protein
MISLLSFFGVNDEVKTLSFYPGRRPPLMIINILIFTVPLSPARSCISDQKTVFPSGRIQASVSIDPGSEADAFRKRSLEGILIIGSKNAYVSRELNRELC